LSRRLHDGVSSVHGMIGFRVLTIEQVVPESVVMGIRYPLVLGKLILNGGFPEDIFPLKRDVRRC